MKDKSLAELMVENDKMVAKIMKQCDDIIQEIRKINKELKGVA